MVQQPGAHVLGEPEEALRLHAGESQTWHLQILATDLEQDLLV